MSNATPESFGGRGNTVGAPLASQEVPRDRPLRVTHVVFDLEGGGMESLVGAMTRATVARGANVSVVTLSGRVGRVGNEIAPIVSKFITVRPRRLWTLLHPASVAHAIAETSPDVVHIHSGCWFVGARAARIARAPRVIFTEHGREFHDPLRYRVLDRISARLTDRIVAVSERLAEYLVERIAAPADRVMTIPNGVDTEKFCPGPRPIDLIATLGLPENALLVGSIGRLEPVKAYDRLLEAVAAINKNVSTPVACVIWGEGSARETLLERARALGISNLVRLPGWTLDTVRSHRALDVFALTSISEGASVSLMEAMACGVPPVATDVGASATILGEPLKEQLVPSGDQSALNQCIERIAGDVSRRRAIGEAARQRVLKHYSFAAMMDAYWELYSDSNYTSRSL